MSYALVQDIAASWHDYQQVAAPLVEPAPAGLILHVAGPTDEGVRIIAVWESEPAWERFRTERLEPAIARLGGPARARSPLSATSTPPNSSWASETRGDRPHHKPRRPSNDRCARGDFDSPPRAPAEMGPAPQLRRAQDPA